jgi:hypothetical protein
MSARKVAPTKAVPLKAAPAKSLPTKRAAAKTAGPKPVSPKPVSSRPVSSRPAPVSSVDRTGETSAVAQKLAAEIDRALARGETDFLSAAALQALMAAVCRSYSAQIEAGSSFPPLAERSRVTSTDVMVTASGLLKSANLAVFELGMWQSWTGR